MDTLNLVQLLADRLRIEIPPVGMAFVQEKPEDIAPLYRDPPSFCSLWRLAELRVFYASAEQHDGCGIGGVVSGFSSSDGREDELALLLTELCEVEVGTTEEIAQTARFEPSGGGVIYGPLWKMPVEPDLALMWATLPQMGVVQEIVGKIMWRNNPQGAVFTRPACGVLPIAHESQKTALSLGCIGMRLYTEIPAHLFLVAMHPSQLPKLERGLESRDDIAGRLEHYGARLSGG
jgi:uncharacterized protein (DUF169 family)